MPEIPERRKATPQIPDTRHGPEKNFKTLEKPAPQDSGTSAGGRGPESRSELGRHLVEHSEEIVDRWYRALKKSAHPHDDVDEHLLRDSLSQQLRIIGRALQSSSPNPPEEMWKIEERLEPEKRVEQHISIDEEVLSYKILVSVVREWVEEHGVLVFPSEYAFFYDSVFELVAKSMKRYTDYREVQALDERTQYLASITHQMKTPIATLSLAVQLINEDPIVEPDIQASMQRAVHRLKVMAGGLMRLERFSAEELPVRPSTIVVEDFLEEIIADHRPRARERAIEIITEIETGLEIEADRDLLIDAVDNVVQNAIRHGAQDEIIVRAHREEGTVLIEVVDDGFGIPPERQSELFKPVTPGTGGGAGIGLTIAHRAVVAQMGDIGLESEPGDGCRVWIRLPLEVRPRA